MDAREDVERSGYATAGYTTAQLTLDRMHLHAKDFAEAEAQFTLGGKHCIGEGKPLDLVEARRMFGLVAALGNATAQAALGAMQLTGQGGPLDLAEARRLLTLATAQDQADAQTILGNMFLHHGDGGPQDLAEARRLFGLAAAQGEASAQNNLGSMHYVGSTHYPSDPDEARRLYDLAAAQGHPEAQVNLGAMYCNGEGGPQDLAEARRLYELAAAQGNVEVHVMLGSLLQFGQGGPKDLARARQLYELAAARGDDTAREALDALDLGEEAQRAKQQTGADATPEQQLVAEDVESRKATCAAKSAKSAKRRKARSKSGKSPSASPGVDTVVEERGEAQEVLMPVAPSPAAEPAATKHAAPEPIAPCIDAGGAAPAIGASTGQGRGGFGLSGRGRGRGGQPGQSAAAIATNNEAAGAVAYLLGQVSLQVPAGSFDAGTAALVAATAPVALDRPPPPPTAVTSLADAHFNTGRQEAPESTIGGQSTCIVCFTNPKSHVAVPCGHQCACGNCSALMAECPVCRSRVQTWVHVRVA